MLPYRKALEQEPASMGCTVNQEEATFTHRGLNPEVDTEERGTSQWGAVVQKIG